jgi:hypothetical protein
MFGFEPLTSENGKYAIGLSQVTPPETRTAHGSEPILTDGENFIRETGGGIDGIECGPEVGFFCRQE